MINRMLTKKPQQLHEPLNIGKILERGNDYCVYELWSFLSNVWQAIHFNLLYHVKALVLLAAVMTQWEKELGIDPLMFLLTCDFKQV